MVTLTHEHYKAAIDLLMAANLPYRDIDFERQHFIGLFKKDQLIAIGGLEIYDLVGLLRSVSVHPLYQHVELGTKVVRSIEQYSRTRNIKTIYLLTETVGSFFSRLGYSETDRKKVPESIKNSNEFKHLCPDSAICMTSTLIP